jgi:hypothetical protein
MYDEQTMSIEERCRLLEHTPSGRLAAEQLRAQAGVSGGTATFAGTSPSISPDPRRIGLTDGTSLGLSWRGSDERPPTQYVRQAAEAAWSGRNPPIMRPTGMPAYQRYVEGFLEGVSIGLAEPVSSAHSYSPRVSEILNYDSRRRLLAMTPAGQQTLEREFERRREASPYAGADAPGAYAASQGQVPFSTADPGVVSSDDQQALADGVREACRLHREGRASITSAELAELGLGHLQERVRGRYRGIQPGEREAYLQAFRAGFEHAWSKQQGQGGGQGREAALVDEARRMYLRESEAGRSLLQREDQRMGRG